MGQKANILEKICPEAEENFIPTLVREGWLQMATDGPCHI